MKKILFMIHDLAGGGAVISLMIFLRPIFMLLLN